MNEKENDDWHKLKPLRCFLPPDVEVGGRQEGAFLVNIPLPPLVILVSLHEKKAVLPERCELLAADIRMGKGRNDEVFFCPHSDSSAN